MHYLVMPVLDLSVCEVRRGLLPLSISSTIPVAAVFRLVNKKGRQKLPSQLCMRDCKEEGATRSALKR